MSDLRKNESCPTCGRFDNRGVTIDAVIIKGKKILLIKRGAEPFKNHWALPGGYVEWNETVEETLKREVKEETNLEVTNFKRSGVYSNPKRDPRQPITVAFLVNANGECEAGDDAQKVKWFNLNKIPKKLAFDHKKIIKDAKVQTESE